ncbi:MAG: 4Fe-4S dicluster domain-containing protein [Rikenellaceae bacterium]
MNKLRILRITLASICTLALTLLFLDFSGTLHHFFGWIARVQFLPALLALNVVVITALIVLTLFFGRLYCSVICPLGVFQDVVSRVASKVNRKRKFSWSAPRTLLRWSMVALLIIAFVCGIGSVVALFDPYSSYGVMVSNLLSPIYKLGNNILAHFAERLDSYALYSVDIYVATSGVIITSLVILGVVGYLAWRGGRTYCNTICPVGTVLGFVSRFSFFRIEIDHSKCNGCQRCVRSCKSSCIPKDSREIDYERCVVCFDCIDSCTKGAVSYRWRWSQHKASNTTNSNGDDDIVDSSKRTMLTISTTLLATTALRAEDKLVDGGLALIESKKIPKRSCRIVPAGSQSIRNFSKHCTGCQLCVTACPNGVLRPSTGLNNFMQPEMSYERGYCRPECTACSQVCPTGAIERVDKAEKSAVQIGHAVWIEQNCVVLTDGVNCGNCAAHCPVGAISMVVAKNTERYGERKIPMINIERCIGCGACENLCPSRPFSAIYVEGHSIHNNI